MSREPGAVHALLLLGRATGVAAARQGFRLVFPRLKDRKGKAEFPRFQAKNRFDSAEFRVGDGLTIRKAKRLGITGISGEIKVKWHRPIPEGAKVGAAVLSRSNGKWFVCSQIEVPTSAVERAPSCIGLDMGLSSLVALSRGKTIAAPQWTKTSAKSLRRRQRALSRRWRFSAGWKRARRALARHQAKTAARRRDFLHKLSHRLVSEHSRIALENLNVRGLALNRPDKVLSKGKFKGHIQGVFGGQ